jgi:hypothetical protein
MNKLEEKFFHEFNSPTAYELRGNSGFEFEEYLAKVSAKIAIDLAREAFNSGYVKGHYAGKFNLEIKDWFDEWLEVFLLDNPKLNSGKD